MNRTRAGAGLLAAVVLLAASACRRQQDPLLTYFNADHLVSVRYPAGWRSEEAPGEGIWSRHFMAPAAAGERSTSLYVTLLAGPIEGTVEHYAQSYLAGQNVASAREESRQGVPGKAWRFSSPDGGKRYALLLLADGGQVWGLYAQGPAAPFEQHRSVMEEMEKSLTLERLATWEEHRNDRQGFALRVPRSWRTGQAFSRSDSHLVQFISPPLAAEKRQTIHASLTVNVEAAPPGGLEAYRTAVLQRLGDVYARLTHVSWRGGYVDMLRTETPLAVSRVKRYFWVSGSRGYSLSCEAREDAFPRVTRWCDVIASTLELDGKPLPPQAEATAPTPAPPATLRVR